MRTLVAARRAEAHRSTKASDGTQLADRAVGALCAAISPSDSTQASDNLRDQIVSCFLPIRSEIDTRPLIAALNDAGARVVLPTVAGDDPDLVFRAWAPGEPLARGAFGVEEPTAAAPIVDPTIMIVPLLAFDRDGYRLGYGGGYYDRAIARLSADQPIPAIGVAYDAQEVVVVPREPHDRRLDAIVTPTHTISLAPCEAG